MSPGHSGFAAAECYSLLGALDRWTVDALGELDEPFALLVVGGAAISMQWNPRRLTHDVDVVSEGLPPVLWKGAAAVAARREGVRADWINNAAKAKVLSPRVDAAPTLLYAGKNLRVYGASARYVTAMKAVSGRPWDLEDLPAVLAESGFESLDAALEWVERAHSGRQIPVSARFYLKNAWDAAAASQRRPPAAGPACLWVRPSAGSDGWGWDIELRPPGRVSLSGGVRYPSMDAALQASGFAQTLLNMVEPLRFEEWEQGWELREPMPGHWGVRVLPVPRVGGWALYAFGPAGDQRAVSPLYPTQRSAASAQRFVQDAQATLAASVGDDRVHLRCVAVCACRDQGLGCRHHTDTYPAVNQVSVSIRPRPDATQDWEVVVRADDGDPIRVSSPFPTEAAAAGTRNFALAVANATHPIHFEGWKPWLRGGPGYRPPPPDQAATTVRIKPPSSPKSDGWRLQARRADGFVAATSLPYPNRQAAAEALDLAGTLSVLAGDPARAGRVRDTTTSTDRACACHTLGTDCLHYQDENPDDRRPNRSYRGPDIGL